MTVQTLFQMKSLLFSPCILLSFSIPFLFQTVQAQSEIELMPLPKTEKFCFQPIPKLIIPELDKPFASSHKPLSRSWLKPTVVLGSSAAILGSLYAYMNNAWWKDSTSGFRFDNGRDFRYANNLDKMGHFMGGLITADAYYDAFKWMSESDESAAWWGFSMGVGIQLAMEIKDGRGVRWGFSIADLAAGSIGAFQPYLRLKSPFFHQTQFKWSYWQRNMKYFREVAFYKKAYINDDYLNQTYWMTTSLPHLTGHRLKWLPDWLGLSLGWGIEAESWDTNPNDRGTGGKIELYLAPDIDWFKLLKPKKAFWKHVIRRLNYIKTPMPTLQLTQKPRGWWLYF
jgi:hypothetical protein